MTTSAIGKRLTRNEVWQVNNVRNEIRSLHKELANCKASDTAHKTQIIESLLFVMPQWDKTLNLALYPEDRQE